MEAERTPSQRAITKVRRTLWRRLTRLFARELLRDLYLGILGRESDQEAIAAYIEKPERIGAPVDVITNLLDSEEFQGKSFARHAPYLARTFYRGILGRDPDAEGLKECALKLTHREDLKGVLAELIGSEEFRGRSFSRFAPDLAQAFYLAILGREPDAEGLKGCAHKLSHKENLKEVLAELIASDEFRRRSVAALSPDLVNAVYAGLFGRKAAADELASSSAMLAEEQDFAALLRGIVNSEEFQAGSFALLAPELARAFHRGILGREGSAEAVKATTNKLAKKERVEGVLAELVRLDEFKEKHLNGFALLAPEIVRASYRAIMGREADPEGLKTFTLKLSRKENLEGVLSQMIGSQEFRQKRLPAIAAGKIATAPPLSSPVRGDECWVFLHIHKTAGTSIQTLLSASFPAGSVFKEHDDTLSKRPPAELSKYSAFAGHFNYDSLSYIPRKPISLVTFVREPIARLGSYYHFRRAHEPGHHLFGFEMQAANELDMEGFFRNSRIKVSRSAWNHMTWAIMGERQWVAWQRQILGNPEPASVEKFIDSVARPAIRERLKGFSFVGLQEEFERSVKMLFKTMGKRQPESIPADNSLKGLMKEAPHFKKKLDPQPISPSCKQAMENLVRLDEVVYQEAKILFDGEVAGHEQAEASLESPETGAGALPESTVRLAYELMQDGTAESQGVLKSLQTLGSVADLKNAVLGSTHFATKTGTFSLEALTWQQTSSVDTEATPEQFSLLFERIRSQWTKLGEAEPHWSVLTNDHYRSRNFAGREEEFYKTAQREALMIERFFERAGLQMNPAATVLELGCGTGRVTHLLAERYAHVIAVDISPGNLLLCEEKLRQCGKTNVEFILLKNPAEIDNIPPFDFFFSTIVLQHNPPPVIRYFLSAILGKIRPSGLALFQVPTHSPGYSFDVSRYLSTPPPLMEMHCLPMRTVFNLLAKYRLTPIEVLMDGWTGLVGSHTFFAIRE